jgi:hypothetical protein
MIKLVRFNSDKYAKLLLMWANDPKVNQYFNTQKKTLGQITKILNDKKTINLIIAIPFDT